MRLFSRVLPAALVLSLSVFATAQAKYPIDKIVISGGAPYTDVEILSAASFQPGQVLTKDTLANPAQHLLDTGLFDSAEMSLGGPGNRTAMLSLKPTPLNTLLPASFENFVWWTPEELTEAIHAHVPLYRGVCSDAGNLPDIIQAALQTMLSEKGINATVSHTEVEPSTTHPHRVINFAIDTPRIRIASVHLSGVPQPLAAAMQQVSNRLSQALYNEGLSGATTSEALLRPLHDAGYIHATLEDVQRSPVSSGNDIGVNLSVRLNAGEAYQVKSIEWQPTEIYSADDFTRDAAKKPATLPPARTLDYDEAIVIATYHAHGYIDAYVDPSPTLDEAAHTVSYSLHVVPGDQYRFKSVTALNLTPEAQAEFDRGWTMKPNDVYNEAYVAKFINNNTALLHLARYAGTFQAIGDPQTHMVDVTITFLPHR